MLTENKSVQSMGFGVRLFLNTFFNILIIATYSSYKNRDSIIFIFQYKLHFVFDLSLIYKEFNEKSSTVC